MTMNRLLATMAITLGVFLFSLVLLTVDDRKTISTLEITVDSLRAECYNKDTAIDEATRTAIQLSDKLNELYEIHPKIHKELFSK